MVVGARDDAGPEFTTKKRSVIIWGRNTSVNLEEDFWIALREIAAARGITAWDLVGARARSIDAGRQHTDLSSAIRLFVLRYYRDGKASQST